MPSASARRARIVPPCPTIRTDEPGWRRGDRPHGLEDAVAHRGVGLDALPAVAGRAVAAQPLREAFLDLLDRQARPLADVDLAEVAPRFVGRAERLRDDLRGLARAPKVAGVDR